MPVLRQTNPREENDRYPLAQVASCAVARKAWQSSAPFTHHGEAGGRCAAACSTAAEASVLSCNPAESLRSGEAVVDSISSIGQRGRSGQSRAPNRGWDMARCLNRLAPHADVSRLHDDESVEEVTILCFHELTDSLRQSSAGVAGKSNQDYARKSAWLTKQASESPCPLSIGYVSRGPLARSVSDHRNSWSARSGQRRRSQRRVRHARWQSHNTRREEAQAVSMHQFGCNKIVSWASRVGSECQCRLNVFPGQAWIRI